MADRKLDLPQGEESETPETSRFPKEDEFEKNLTNSATEIVSKIKWQFNFTNRKTGGQPFDREHAGMQLRGLLRGDLAERLSDVLQPDECQTIYNPAGLNVSDFKITSFSEVTGQKTKEGVLIFAVKKSLEESPLKSIEKYLGEVIKDAGKRKVVIEQITQEIVDGYSSKGYGKNAGIFYGETIIPDGALLDKNGVITGLVEVKGYLPEEFKTMVMSLQDLDNKGLLIKPITEVGFIIKGKEMGYNLGFDIKNEVEFVDIFRNASSGLPSLENYMPIILRFPNDISDELISEYGKIIMKLGYEKVILQKLPYSSTELSERSRKFIEDNINTIKERKVGGAQFSDREIKVLESFAKSSV